MQDVLTKKLYQHICENYPDMLFSLEEENKTSSYLTGKIQQIDDLIKQLQEVNTPDYVVEEVCLDTLIKDLPVSKFNYVKKILEEEFEYAFYNFQRSGLLQPEVINIINKIEEVLDDSIFNEEAEDNRKLRYAVIGIISVYLS